MQIILDIFDFIGTQILSAYSIILGIVALVGLLLLKRPAHQVISGVIKTIVGVLIISAGAGVLVGGISPLTNIINHVLGVQGVLPTNEAALPFALATLVFPACGGRREAATHGDHADAKPHADDDAHGSAPQPAGAPQPWARPPSPRSRSACCSGAGNRLKPEKPIAHRKARAIRLSPSCSWRASKHQSSSSMNGVKI